MQHKLPLAELHVHIEGTVKPETARSIAARNGMTLDPALFSADGSAYRYESFLDLVTKVYQAVASGIRTKRDFTEITEEYLLNCAAEGAIYVELIACPGQCWLADISYKDMIDGIAEGIDNARAKTGIEARINVDFERHRPGSEAEKDADAILSYPHAYIVRLDIAGGEQEGDIPQFRKPFERILKNFGRDLCIRMHAGEGAGAKNVRAALDMGCTRIGHGIRCIEDADLVNEIVKKGVVLEVCPTSNCMLMPQLGGKIENHPLRQLYDAGVKLTLNSDDPGMFDCTLGGEYDIARTVFGFTESELHGITRTAINAAACEAALKTDLLRKVDAYQDAGEKRKTA